LKQATYYQIKSPCTLGALKYEKRPAEVIENKIKSPWASWDTRLICNLTNIFCFANSFQKMRPSAFRVSGKPPGLGVECWGQNCTKTFLGQVGMRVQNFIKIGAGVWISVSISPPHGWGRRGLMVMASSWRSEGRGSNPSRVD